MNKRNIKLETFVSVCGSRWWNALHPPSARHPDEITRRISHSMTTTRRIFYWSSWILFMIHNLRACVCEFLIHSVLSVFSVALCSVFFSFSIFWFAFSRALAVSLRHSFVLSLCIYSVFQSLSGHIIQSFMFHRIFFFFCIYISLPIYYKIFLQIPRKRR